MRHLPSLDPAYGLRVADALGHLPLAIEQAAAWLEQTGISAQEYVAQLATQTRQILELIQPSNYPTTVGAAWNLSLEQLKRTSPAMPEKLSENHPDALICRSNLAIGLRETGRREEADALRNQLLEHLATALGTGTRPSVSYENGGGST